MSYSPWQLFPFDAAAVCAGVATDNRNNTTAPKALDEMQSTLWEPQSQSADWYWTITGSSPLTTFYGIGLGNHNLFHGTATLLYKSAGGVWTALTAFDINSSRDIVLLESAPRSTTGWLGLGLRCTSTGDVIKIGTISLLCNHRIRFQITGPGYPINRGIAQGSTVMETPGGSPLTRQYHRPRVQFTLPLTHGTFESGLAFDLMEQSFAGNPTASDAVYEIDRINHSWCHGIWLTDHTHQDDTADPPYRGYYCRCNEETGFYASATPPFGELAGGVVLTENGCPV
jgi:hypothetical protein